MRFPRSTAALLALTATASLFVGCDSSVEADKLDPKAIESAFKDSAEPAPAAGGTEESTTETLRISADGNVPVKEVAAKAAQAMRKDDLSEAMVMLQTLRRARNLSPDQLTAVQDQMAALQADLANRAQSGDLKAKQALQLIQQSTRW